jgi:peroxiredoxin Q/BCP
MISAGDKLKLKFRVKAVAGGAVREVEFGELLRRRTIVSVYMKNNTSSCDRQLKSLVAAAKDLGAAGYDVVALSRDSANSHVKAAAKHKVPFTLVSDPEDLFAKAAASLVTKSMYGKEYIGPARAAFLLEPDGRVRAVIEKVDTADHAAQLQAAIGGK